MPDSRHWPILVIEDSAEDMDTVREAARRAGVTNSLVHAADAGDAWRELDASPGRPQFAFVLLDQSLPGTRGDALVRDMRVRERLRELPVVVLSGSNREEDRIACYASGANAYHTKDVSFAEHLRTVQNILRYWLIEVALPGRSLTRKAAPD